MDSPTDVLDEAAMERLYARLETPVYNVVYRWLWDREEARDVVQEAFMKLWKKRDSVRMDTVDPLLYRMALNLASNRRRYRKLRSWLPLPSQEVPEEAWAGRREEQEAVRAAVEGLPEDLRQVVMLTELGGLSYKEVAEVVQIPEGTVGSRRNRALRTLRETLGESA